VVTPSHEAIRIARGGGIPATQHIIQNADKLTKLASYGSMVVISYVG